MIEQLTPSFRITCDRCGKTRLSDNSPRFELRPVHFVNGTRTIRYGEVCNECYKDFRELAENFLDEVNRDE